MTPGAVWFRREDGSTAGFATGKAWKNEPKEHGITQGSGKVNTRKNGDTTSRHANNGGYELDKSYGKYLAEQTRAG